MQNKVQLITYADRLASQNLAELRQWLEGPFAGLFGGIHILPFFYPIDGSDAGFDPIDHYQVDPRLGDWTAVGEIGQRTPVMADLIVNHVSDRSSQFLDFSENGADSRFAGMFLTLDKVFPDGASEADLLAIYRPRPGLPLRYMTLANGEKRILWTTFTPQQLDIDVRDPEGLAYLHGILDLYARSGITMIRLDAAGYAIKKAGTSSFMIPESFDFIAELTEYAHARGIEVLVEVHAYYQRQIEVAQKVDYVYDFALPPLVLHGLYSGTATVLKHWLEIAPRNAITVLDTHDGIGVIDVGRDATDPVHSPGLLTPEQMDELVEGIHTASVGQSRKATGEAASNLDLYQVNCTFYDALGRDDHAYLLARLIQFFAPGIPQVYYVGLLAGTNDMELLARTQVGRDINRHYYSPDEVEAAVQRPVVQNLFRLIRFRNAHPAFAGRFSLPEQPDPVLCLRWEKEAHWAEAEVDLSTRRFRLRWSEGGGARESSSWEHIIYSAEST
ncbi:MAG: sucrose phosphorylase [Bacteroidetes bacterium]|nr:MAG: sucrose phosphorylase [Bacteroidota bacterium]